MTANYFRALASRCRKANRECFDLFAKEEFRRLEAEFNTKANEVEGALGGRGQTGWWRSHQRAEGVDR
jgi:hypothetical protein